MYRCKICGLVGLMLDMNYHFKKNDSKHPGKSEDWEEHVELIDDVTGKPKEESVDVKKLKAEPVKDEDKLIIKDTDTGKK